MMHTKKLIAVRNFAAVWFLACSFQGVAQDRIAEDLQTWLFGDAQVVLTAKWNVKGKTWEGLLKDATHTGLDYAGPEGTPVYSISGGIVVKVTIGADGRTLGDLSTVAIYNKNADVTFIYLHMKEIAVTLNDNVETGQHIGQIGQRGPATGPHLHFEARPGKQVFAALDVNNTVNPYEAAKNAKGNLSQTTEPAPIWFNVAGISGRMLVGVCGYADNQLRAFTYEVETWPTGNGRMTDGDGLTVTTVGPILCDPARFKIIEFPGASWIRPMGIDGANIIGQYCLNGIPGEQSFVYDGKSLTKIASSGSGVPVPVPFPTAISGSHIVGVYGSDRQKSFIYEMTNKSWTLLEKPNARSVIAHGVSGDIIVGYYYGTEKLEPPVKKGKGWVVAETREHGFVYNLKDRSWSNLDYPGALATFPWAVDGRIIVGAFSDGRGKSLHGFIHDGRNWTAIEVPGWGPVSRAGDPNAFLRGVSGNAVLGQNSNLYLLNEKRWTHLLSWRLPDGMFSE